MIFLYHNIQIWTLDSKIEVNKLLMIEMDLCDTDPT